MLLKNVNWSSGKLDSPQISFFNNIVEKYSKISLNTTFNPLISLKLTVDNIKNLPLENKIDYPLILYKGNKLIKNQNLYLKKFRQFLNIENNLNKNFSCLKSHFDFLLNLIFDKNNSINDNGNIFLENIFFKFNMDKFYKSINDNGNIFLENIFFKFNMDKFYKSKMEKLFSTINLINSSLIKDQEYNLSDISILIENKILIHKSDSEFLLNLISDKNNFSSDSTSINLQNFLNINSENLELNNNAFFENMDLNFINSKHSNLNSNLSSNTHMEYKKNDIVIENLNEKYEKLNNSFNELNYSYDEMINKNYSFDYSDLDVDNLANEVYSIIERKLIIEKERRGTFVRF